MIRTTRPRFACPTCGSVQPPRQSPLSTSECRWILAAMTACAALGWWWLA